MTIGSIKYYHLLLIYSKVKYDFNTNRSIVDKFIVSSFADHVEKNIVKLMPISSRSSSDTLKNCFSKVRKGNYEDLQGDKKVVPRTLAVFCGFSSLKEFQESLPTIVDEQLAVNYEEVYNYLYNEGKVEFKWCLKVLKSLKIDIDAESRKKSVIELPNNWLSPSFCLNLEMESRRVVTNVITSNMNWADHYKESIIHAAQELESHYLYLLTSDKGANSMYNLLELAEEQGVSDKIRAIKVSDRIQKEKFNLRKEYPLFQTVAGVVFPLPNDIVIYTNVPDSKTQFSRYFFKDRWSRNSIAVIGTTPFSHDQELDKVVTYYDIAIEPKVAKEILSWFNYVWEILTGEKPPKTND